MDINTSGNFRMVHLDDLPRIALESGHWMPFDVRSASPRSE